MCEFSRPLPDKPNPISTVRVYFFIDFNKQPITFTSTEEGSSPQQNGKQNSNDGSKLTNQNFMNPQILKLTENMEIRFRFENDSLYHNPRSTVNTNMIEKWLEKYLD